MDSLTQITLGAAVGEIVLGKKVGNRAILWGAVGGTIPDLDVVTGAFLSPIQELAAHRGFSHSIVFAVLGAFLFGWLIHKTYQSSYHRYFAVVGWMFIPVGVIFFVSRIFDNASFGLSSSLFLGAVILTALYLLFSRYFKKGVEKPDTSIREWQWLMFWSLFTHPVLDCFTTYGTQLFLPFSNYRVALNTVAVFDPFYTAPFLICVIVLSFLKRSNHKRRVFAWAGIGISSAYLLFCIINKQRVNSIWLESVREDEIAYSRFMTSPSIMSNFLWTCIAETEDGYVSGQYSVFDKEPKVHFEFIPRNPDGLDVSPDDPTISCMRWFSNDYYSLIKHSAGFQFNDLRFGSVRFADQAPHYIFNFVVEQKASGELEMLGSNGGPPPGSEREMMSMLISRIKGI